MVGKNKKPNLRNVAKTTVNNQLLYRSSCRIINKTFVISGNFFATQIGYVPRVIVSF